MRSAPNAQLLTALAASTRSAVTRRRLLQAAGLSGAALAAAACGATAPSAEGGTGNPTARTQPDPRAEASVSITRSSARSP